ncbi:protein unc-13 homolog 4B [Eupeodes corollae]|uniref:protein unc-13 homolog 4B n=1 Tax=Eupeodes corollae TaxID=290404 RepID=UPI0024915C9C|nr:protein unc-13 homolog 4B [Eupeodes corollae]XP_055903172.1 protein unc-13 homolog 4B [Eupeodes corollae]XP_055903173.1 protein unc-13 homolog 4B [Eupeodes corollae]
MATLNRTASILDENVEEMSVLTIHDGDGCGGGVVEEQITSSKVQHLLSAVEEKSLDVNTDVPDNIIENSTGRNIEELYGEILFETLNNIGCPNSQETCPESLLDFIRDAFKVSQSKHDELYEIANGKEPPKVRLNVEIIKAENLMPKDYNGMSDPFVTLYIESNAVHRYNTSVKPMTLNPVWNEYFSLPIPDDPSQETLVVEVWDFDAAETVGKKMNKFFEVKGVKGLRKFMKEIAYSAATTVKDDNELIGRSVIPLNSIPASGMRVWYHLEKGTRSSRTRGSVLMHLCFSAEKDSRVAAQEHRNLLRILLMHELESSTLEPYLWSGKYETQAEAIITQHYIQSGLSEVDLALCQWDAYTNVHEHHPLSFSLFNTILHKVIETLPTYSADSDFVKTFWEASRRILPSCFYIIRKIRQETFTQKLGVNMLCDVLEILQIFDLLTVPIDVDLFPRSTYGWLGKRNEDDDARLDVKLVLTEAIRIGARDWVNTIKETCEFENENPVQQLNKLVQLMRFDVQRAIEFHHKHFFQTMKLKYAKILYVFYQENIVEFCKPVVIDACDNLVRLPEADVDNVEQFENIDDYTMGTHLFELYLSLKRYISLGTALCTAEEQGELLVYYEWFAPAVSHWLDISLLKALSRIKKAIDLDEFQAVDGNIRHSSSALDTLSIFYTIKIFWEQLAWPDIQGSYAFVGKIVDDVCKCCAFYATRITKRIAEFTGVDPIGPEEFEVTKEWCVAICNIGHIQKSIPAFVRDLGVDGVLKNLGESLSSVEADRCRETIHNVIENAQDTVQNRIAALIAEVAAKMIPVMRGYLFNGIDSLNEELSSVEGLFMYLEKSLAILHAELDEETFERMIDSIWQGFSAVFYELVQGNLDKRRPPSFFVNLREVLNIMASSFKYEDKPFSEITTETLANVQKLLELHASETDVLIHQYYKERFERQKVKAQSVYGQLTVKAIFAANNVLHVHVLNAKNLLPMDSNNLCDSFVKMYYIPLDRFGGIATHKTGVQSKTLFPLYDEEFKVQLTTEHREQEDNMLVFSIKDRDLFGMSSQYLAECYLSFADIIEANGEQIRLNLSRPEYTPDSDCIRALECRQIFDKNARDFIKKLKQRAY